MQIFKEAEYPSTSPKIISHVVLRKLSYLCEIDKYNT